MKDKFRRKSAVTCEGSRSGLRTYQYLKQELHLSQYLKSVTSLGEVLVNP